MEKTYPLIIISGPSGTGEDSIIEGLKGKLPIERVITTNTREMRPGESPGKPYYFISRKEFAAMKQAGDFFESAQEYENYYGVTDKELARVRKSGKIGIWKIGYKGVTQAKKKLPGIIAILINAPLDILEKRIRRRGNVSEQYVKDRMEYTKDWLKHKDIYDYEVINEEGKLQETIDKVEGIIRNELKERVEA